MASGALWDRLESTASGRPVLVPREVELVYFPDVGVYDHLEDTNLGKSLVTLTTHRLIVNELRVCAWLTGNDLCSRGVFKLRRRGCRCYQNQKEQK